MQCWVVPRTNLFFALGSKDVGCFDSHVLLIVDCEVKCLQLFQARVEVVFSHRRDTLLEFGFMVIVSFMIIVSTIGDAIRSHCSALGCCSYKVVLSLSRAVW